MKETSLPLFQQLDALDQELNLPQGYTGASRWLIPYADLLTLLLGLFVIMYASIYVQEQKKGTERPQMQVAQGQALAQPINPAVDAQNPPSADQARALEANLLKALQDQGEKVTVKQDPRGLVISFQERIFFEPGQATLTPGAEQTLDKLASALQALPQSIRVEGHTDNTPIHTAQFPSNWELSTMRATNIVKSLVERHHFSPERLSAAGFGEFYPLEDNSTNQGKQKNRRVDIVLLSTGLPAQTEQTLPPPAIQQPKGSEPDHGSSDASQRSKT